MRKKKREETIGKINWAALLLALTFVLGVRNARAQGALEGAEMSVQGSMAVEEAVQALIGRGIRTKNVRFTGVPQALGSYSHGGNYPAFQEGLILSTGKAADFAGPNDQPKASTVNGYGGDRDLSSMAGTRTFDMAAIDFDFMTDRDSVSLSFYFASEEYNEFVGSTFNDVFAIVITGPGFGQGKNLALVPGTNKPIHINTVSVHENRRYYRDNNPFNLHGSQDDRLKAKLKKELLENCQFDGMTRPFSVGVRVKPKTKYHLKIIIADAGDGANDSAVMLEGGSFSSEEQYWRVVRRRQIEEQRIADSIARADSIAAVLAAQLAAIQDSIRQDSIQRAEAALELETGGEDGGGNPEGRPFNPDAERPREVDVEIVEIEEVSIDEINETVATGGDYHSIASNTQPEVKLLFRYVGDDYFIDESEDSLVERLASYLQANPDKKAGLFTPDGSQNADLRYDIIRTDLIKAGVSPRRIFRNGFSFLSTSESAGSTSERLEVWVR